MYMYQPLINRLKSEDVARISEYSITYPTSAKYLTDTLNRSTNWLTLEYDVICLLNDVFSCGYNPSAISKLFPTNQ